MIDCLSPPPDRDRYCQADLRFILGSQIVRKTRWIPQRFAIVGRTIMFKGDSRTWDITAVYSSRIGPPERDYRQFQYEKYK